MYYFWLSVFPALAIFVARVPATLRRIRAQREALRPIAPIKKEDHLICIVHTIGVVLTEFFLLGLISSAVFILSSLVIGTLGQAPSMSVGIRNISAGSIFLIASLAAVILYASIFKKTKKKARDEKEIIDQKTISGLMSIRNVKFCNSSISMILFAFYGWILFLHFHVSLDWNTLWHDNKPLLIPLFVFIFFTLASIAYSATLQWRIRNGYFGYNASEAAEIADFLIQKKMSGPDDDGEDGPRRRLDLVVAESVRSAHGRTAPGAAEAPI